MPGPQEYSRREKRSVSSRKRIENKIHIMPQEKEIKDSKNPESNNRSIVSVSTLQELISSKRKEDSGQHMLVNS